MYGIDIDLSRDSLFDELGIKRLKESYMKDDEVSPQERFAFVSKAFSSNPSHAQRLYDYSSKHWLSYSTPILSFGRNSRGLPISCYLNFIADTAAGLVENLSETNWLSMMGGGVGVHVRIRGADEKSVGVMPHLKTYDASSLAYRQGRTRRGSYAAYLDISHPDIVRFLEMRKPTGDQNMRTLNLNHGINVTNEFMEIIERCMLDPNADDSWQLKQPNNGAVVETVSAKELWMRILEMRMQTGEPYLWFIDTANEGLPDYQKKLGLKNNGSNLCLTGDTIIDVKYDAMSEPISIRLDHFIEKFELGYFTDPLVKTFQNGEVVWSKVSNAAKTADVTELYEIETPGGHIIRCTGDHKIYTKNRGYVEARLLEETDELLEIGFIVREFAKDELTFRKVNLDQPVPVYDITVPETESFFANDVLVHNCSEISLATSEDRTAVCCLSSLNLEHYDDWKDDPLFVGDVLEMLDNVVQYFIDNAPDTIKRAKYSALRERSVGIGALGFHAFLQKNNIAFEGVMAKSLNNRIFKSIRDQLNEKNEQLALERGACPDAAEFGVMKRLSHVMSVAPNACQSKDNVIRTADGNMTVGEFLVAAGVDTGAVETSLQKQWVELDTPMIVPTLDGDKEVTQVWYNGYEEVIEIEFEDGKKYKFTENHRLLVKTILGDTEWVRVGDLTGDEDIVSI